MMNREELQQENVKFADDYSSFSSKKSSNEIDS